VRSRGTRAFLAGLLALLGLTALVGSVTGATSPVPQIAIAGPRQMVFDWSEQACEPTQAADLPTRAFRDDRGRVQLLLSHFDNFRMVGPTLDRLRVDCEAVMRSDEDDDPANYRDREWLAALFTRDGHRVWALVHDEYQGHLRPARCPQGNYHRCWYNTITLARSSNAGRSYSQVGGPVAAAPYRYRPGIGPAGLFAPSNLVESDDGYLKALVRVRDPGRRRGICLIRTRSIESMAQWRAWDGAGFAGNFTNPYRGTPRLHTDCEILEPGKIAEMSESLTFSTELGRYLLVGMAPPTEGSTGPARRTGIYYSTSEDLVHWSERELLLAAATVRSHRCGGPAPIAYPSLIDPRSRSRTFATSGSHPYLYFTQFRYQNCKRTPNRDLLRVPVEISG